MAGDLTIGSAPDSGALYLTQGVVRVVGGSTLNFLLFLCTYLLLYLYVCPRSTPILYHITHTFIAYIHILHIFKTVLGMLETIHMLDTLDTNYAKTMLVKDINKPT